MNRLALVLALAALGFLMVTDSGAQGEDRCSTGEALGIVTIQPFPPHLAGTIGGAFTRDERFFLRRYNCTGRSAEVRRLATGVYDIHFPGLRIRALAGISLSEGFIGASMQPLGDIARIRLFDQKGPRDGAFSIVVH